MTSDPIYVVDVFAQRRYAGNQLAVVLDSGDRSDEERLALTRETKFSEATFVTDSDPATDRYEVRIFDPIEEIPFAGHPTLGTAFVLREYVAPDRPDELTLNLGVGEVPVWVETDDAGAETYWMRQPDPTFGDRADPDSLARILGLSADDIDSAYPIQLVSTGLPTLIVPLTSLDALQRATTQQPAYDREFLDRFGHTNLLVFAPAGYEQAELSVRVFADYAGVPEDPATGSSNGCLAVYLVEHDYFETDEIECTVEQGYEIDRPSRLHLRASRTGPDEEHGSIDVRVGGRVVPVLSGHLH
jgi:trans-2,3-dihydro-3-hydroxyanthranilate isomerase